MLNGLTYNAFATKCSCYPEMCSGVLYHVGAGWGVLLLNSVLLQKSLALKEFLCLPSWVSQSNMNMRQKMSVLFTACFGLLMIEHKTLSLTMCDRT